MGYMESGKRKGKFCEDKFSLIFQKTWTAGQLIYTKVNVRYY